MRFGEKQEGKVKVTLNNVRISCNNIVALLRALYIEVSCHRLRAAPGACLWLCMVSHFVRCRYATFYKNQSSRSLRNLSMTCAVVRGRMRKLDSQMCLRLCVKLMYSFPLYSCMNG